MKYYEVEFTIEADDMLMESVRDVLSAIAGDAGFETFEETEKGLKGYIQQSVYQDNIPKQIIESLPFDQVVVNYQISEAPDDDWNAQWEQEGFDPILIDNRCIIHDGRHLNGFSAADFEVSVEIDAHLAFGTGNHETTRMMVASLLDLPLVDKRVLDCGCGTGILSITALKRGATQAVGYDIDEWSADNARHNAVINGVDAMFTSLLGDASVLSTVEGTFDVVLANINRNILLNDLPAFCNELADNGLLLLSGFYQEDIPLLEAKARTLQLQLIGTKEENNWACIAFRYAK